MTTYKPTTYLYLDTGHDRRQPRANPIVQMTKTVKKKRKDPKSSSSSVETEVVEFAQKTLNFMNKEKNRFVSDQMITDIMAFKLEDKPFGAPALMTTAIIGCNSTQKTANNINELKILRKLAYFVPPIRSLEILHNQMPFQTFLDFIDRNRCSDVDCSKTDPSNTAT